MCQFNISICATAHLPLPNPTCYNKLISFKRRTLHVPNLMQMSENNRFFSFALDLAHVKFDVWNGPYCWVRGGVGAQLPRYWYWCRWSIILQIFPRSSNKTAPRWLHSSLGRALLWYRSSYGFECFTCRLWLSMDTWSIVSSEMKDSWDSANIAFLSWTNSTIRNIFSSFFGKPDKHKHSKIRCSL